MSHDETANRELTPEDLAHAHLPEQTMYRIQLEHDQAAESDDVLAAPVIIRTNEFRLLYFELERDGGIDWHTHAPSMDEVNLCLEGRAKYTLEREDGSHQTLEIGPMEFVYLPGGARHKVESVGETSHTSLSAARFDTVARLEDLEESEPGDADAEWEDALFVDRKRDEVVAKDEAHVSQ